MPNSGLLAAVMQYAASVPDRGIVCAGMVLLVFCNGLLDAWLVLSKRSPIATEKQA